MWAASQLLDPACERVGEETYLRSPDVRGEQEWQLDARQRQLRAQPIDLLALHIVTDRAELDGTREVERFNEVAASSPITWSLPEFSVDTSDVLAASWVAIMAILIIRLAIANARVLSWRRASHLVEDGRCPRHEPAGPVR